MESISGEASKIAASVTTCLVDSKSVIPYRLENYNSFLPSSCVLDTANVVVNYYRLHLHDKVVLERALLQVILAWCGNLLQVSIPWLGAV